MTPPTFQPGDRVVTPIGNHGSVLPPPWEMPNHCLIQIDFGAKLWVLSELLKPSDVPPPIAPAPTPPRTSRRRRRSPDPEPA